MWVVGHRVASIFGFEALGVANHLRLLATCVFKKAGVAGILLLATCPSSPFVFSGEFRRWFGLCQRTLPCRLNCCPVQDLGCRYSSLFVANLPGNAWHACLPPWLFCALELLLLLCMTGFRVCRTYPNPFWG